MADKSKLVTIYAPHNVGFKKYEGRLIRFGERPLQGHAQKDIHAYVTFILKGKRKPQTVWDDFVILDGVGYPDPPDAWTHHVDSSSVKSDTSKYYIFYPRYSIELNEVINPYSARFIADYRRNKTTVLTEAERQLIERWEGQKAGSSTADEAAPAPVEKLDQALLTDDRKRATASLVQRLGQADFRRGLIEAYRGRCAITGCNVIGVLQAAHIVPYMGTQSNATDNGLLLRADIHNLFDLHILSIDPETLTVCLALELRDSSIRATPNFKVFRWRALRRCQPGRVEPV
jgi:HNH endonuclease